MLAIPIVKSMGGLGDTSSMVSALVSQNMCPEEVVRNDIAGLEQYRLAATSVAEPSEAGQQHLLRYCQQLRSFAPRFAGLEAQLKVNLTWSDAFGLTLKTSSHTFYIDLACCLWNLAAFESLMGARLDRTNEDGLKAANKHFQQAAGYLEHIRLQVLPQLTSLGSYPCMSEDGLNMVKNLMLAQGQLCYYEKAVKDKKRDPAAIKASIIAKLAKQTSAFYHTTSVSCKVGVLGSMLDVSWFAVTDFQSKIFQGAAEYWQAHASKEAAQTVGTGYGEEVARYNRADTAVGLALAQSTKFSIAESLLFGANGLRAAIQQHKQTAEHDLRTVYMESVPADYSLQEVGCVSMVRALDVPEPSGPPSGLLFRYVLPQHIRVANAKYKEEIGAILATTATAAESATNAARTALSAKGLPGSLEAAKTEDVLPPSLWAKVQ
jgi:programmed cell death 6-interacting protein